MISNDPFKNIYPGPKLPPIEPIPPLSQQAGFGQTAIVKHNNHKSKRNVCKWLVIGMHSLFYLCGLGICGCTYFLASKTKSVYDLANNFYKAVVTINKENGKYKVCGIRERDGIVKYLIP